MQRCEDVCEFILGRFTTKLRRRANVGRIRVSETVCFALGKAGRGHRIETYILRPQTHVAREQGLIGLQKFHLLY